MNNNSETTIATEVKNMPRLIFREAVQYIRPSDSYTPIFDVEGDYHEFYEDMEEVGRIGKPEDAGILYLERSKSHPAFVHFGYIQNHDSYDHKAGYVWSSRPGVINAAFGTNLIGVTIYASPYLPCSCAVDADYISALIPSEYTIVRVEEDGEVEYLMKKARKE